MATSSLYGTSSESTGLYGIGAASGGTYFEWFIFQDSATAPATPTGGSWSFTTNTGTAPSGWLNAPPASPVNQIWVSIAIVDSRNTSALVWSAPGLMTGSGLPILTGSDVPSSGTGLNGQLYVNTATTPQSMYLKESGTWVQITGSTLYATAGANTNITSLTGITGGISSATYLQLNTAGDGALASGKLQWDTTWNGPQIGMGGGNVNLQIGQETLIYVYNNTGSTLTDGQVVYATGSQGQRLTVSLAQANADATSATILGVVTEPIANNSSGFVTTQGMVNGLNTNGFADGAVIYLSPTTPGAWTTTKPQAPQHLVQVGYVIKGGSGGAGSIYIHPQNGYELNELHDVRITSVANKNLLQYDSAYPAWVNIAGPNGSIVGTTDTQTLTNKTISGSSNTLTDIPNSALVNDSVNVNGVDLTLGAVQLLGADWILPSYTGNAGKVLALNPSASDVQWISAGGVGTVTSIDVSGGTTGLTTTGGPVTAAGTITFGGILNVENGGTGVTTSTGTGSVVLSISPSLVTPALGTPASGNFSTGTFTWPTFNQNTTGNAATATTATNVSGGSASVTTLTASSTVTLDGGTANGVAYLNGSKVLTTGSALTFDGSLLNLAAGSGAAVNAIRIRSASANTNGFNIVTDSTTDNIYLNNFYSAAILFGTGNTERMRLTSTGNLGLGVTPSAWVSTSRAIQGYAGGFALSADGTNNNQMRLSSNTYYNGTNWIYYGASTATSYEQRVGEHRWYNAASGTAGTAITFTQAMTLDASGNLGLGVTPSAWQSASKAIQVNTVGSLFAFSNDVQLGSNVVFSSTGASYRYITTAASSRYAQTGGAHQWFNAASGTAGDAITFTQAMTLNASGNLGVGTSSPSTKLDVAGNSTFQGDVNITSATPSLLFSVPAGGLDSRIYNDGSGNFIFGNGTNSATPTERMRIDSSGNLGLGVTPSAWGSSGWLSLSIGTYAAFFQESSTGGAGLASNAYYNGTNWIYRNLNPATRYISDGISGSHKWFIAPSGTAGNAITFTQAMTLDSSGNLLVATTTASTTDTGNGTVLSSIGGYIISRRVSGATQTHLQFANGGATVGNISSSTTATTYNTSSDYRLKNITGPITTSGAYIDSLNPVEGTWKADGSTFVGLIAHEVQEASRTQVATGVKDGEQMQAMDYSNSELIANLIAEVKSLRARVAALESN